MRSTAALDEVAIRQVKPSSNSLGINRDRTAARLMPALVVTASSPGSAAEQFSFAAITDEPPPEVATEGHNRGIVIDRPENFDAWLDSNPWDLAAVHDSR